MTPRDLLVAVREYLAIADLHDTLVVEFAETFGESDVDQVKELRAAQQFFGDGPRADGQRDRPHRPDTGASGAATGAADCGAGGSVAAFPALESVT